MLIYLILDLTAQMYLHTLCIFLHSEPSHYIHLLPCRIDDGKCEESLPLILGIRWSIFWLLSEWNWPYDIWLFSLLLLFWKYRWTKCAIGSIYTRCFCVRTCFDQLYIYIYIYFPLTSIFYYDFSVKSYIRPIVSIWFLDLWLVRLNSCVMPFKRLLVMIHQTYPVWRVSSLIIPFFTRWILWRPRRLHWKIGLWRIEVGVRLEQHWRRLQRYYVDENFQGKVGSGDEIPG